MPIHNFVKGSLTAIILQLLEENGRMYGYEMTKKVRDNSKGKININEAALYPALHRLCAQGILTTQSEKIDGRIRKYYSLTTKGKKQSQKEIDALKDMLESLSLILKNKPQYG